VRGSSFYAAMRLLPPAERAAMYAVYDFCRQVDDIADDEGPSPSARRAELNRWRAALEAYYATGEIRPETAPLDPYIVRYGLLLADFLAVIDGMEMDVGEPIRAPDFATLDLYCDRVASAVGRLSVRIFGMPPAAGVDLAHHLGRALQFTNILRDLDEDANNGRLYLPAEALAAAGIAGSEPRAVVDHPAIDAAARWLAVKAKAHYAAAEAIIASRPGGRLRAPRLMIGVYGLYLRRMLADGWRAPRRRHSLGKAHLLWIVLSRGLAK
jgi:phytoene synthase